LLYGEYSIRTGLPRRTMPLQATAVAAPTASSKLTKQVP
jgi:hypothetical protein